MLEKHDELRGSDYEANAIKEVAATAYAGMSLEVSPISAALSIELPAGADTVKMNSYYLFCTVTERLPSYRLPLH